MSSNIYNTVTSATLIGLAIAFVVMVVSAIATIVRWKTPNRRRHAIRALVALAAIPCFIGVQQAVLWLVFLPALSREKMAVINAAREKRVAETSLVLLGDAAPRFSLTTADGDKFSLPNDDRVTLINFFATWCGPCLIELPHMERIWAANKHDKRFRMLVIGREETRETVQAFRDENSFTFPIAADPAREVYGLFAEESIPRTLVISPEGRVVYSKVGFFEADLEELHQVLKDQLAAVR